MVSNIHTAYPSLHKFTYTYQLHAFQEIHSYLSPCFKLKNFTGNSCRQAHPNKAVSSNDLYLLLLGSALPATKSLHSACIINYTGVIIVILNEQKTHLFCSFTVMYLAHKFINFKLIIEPQVTMYWLPMTMTSCFFPW